MTERTLRLARSGDEEAFRQLTDPHRLELQLHCYRILGSIHDAEDMVQETLLAAWRGIDQFQGRASLRAWLYRIATNRCLNALRDGTRRPRVLSDPPFAPPEPTRWDDAVSAEPYPDALLADIPDASPGPEARYETREAVELAFIAALQHLPPRQRAVLLLKDVLGYRTEEVASMLEASGASVKGALQRARATLENRLHGGESQRAPQPRSERERAVARKFADAFVSDDIAGVVALLTDDGWMAMPPYPHTYQGRVAVAEFLRSSAKWRGARRYRLMPTRANTQPAFGCYLQDERGRAARAAGLIVLTLDGDRLSGVTRFMDPSLFAYFGLPPILDG